MPGYSIKDLEKLSGVKAHTIRIWEKRYGLLEPDRTDTNIRYYDDDQLKRLLNVAILSNNGYKISEIAELDDQGRTELIRKMLDKQPGGDYKYDIYITELLLAATTYDEAAFEHHFGTCVLKFGFSETIEQVLYPLLYRVGVLWLSADLNPAQEHFLSNLAKRKFFSAIDGLKPADAASRHTVILFLPEQEEHEIGLLYCYYLLLKSGFKTVYLGQRLPLESLKMAAEIVKPTHLVSFFVTHTPLAERQEYINRMASEFSDVDVVICGSQAVFVEMERPGNVSFVHGIPDFKKRLI